MKKKIVRTLSCVKNITFTETCTIKINVTADFGLLSYTSARLKII